MIAFKLFSNGILERRNGMVLLMLFAFFIGLNNADAITSLSVTPTASTCSYGNGKLTFNPAGVVGTVTFQVFNSSNVEVAQTQNLIVEALQAGTYTVKATDSDGSVQETSATVDNNSVAWSVPEYTVTNPTCGLPNGAVTIALPAGVVENSEGSYRISSNNGATYTAYQASGTFSDLPAGTYLFCARDACNDEHCITYSLTNASSVPTLESVNFSNVQCNSTDNSYTGTYGLQFSSNTVFPITVELTVKSPSGTSYGPYTKTMSGNYEDLSGIIGFYPDIAYSVDVKVTNACGNVYNFTKNVSTGRYFNWDNFDCTLSRVGGQYSGVLPVDYKITDPDRNVVATGQSTDGYIYGSITELKEGYYKVEVTDACGNTTSFQNYYSSTITYTFSQYTSCVDGTYALYLYSVYPFTGGTITSAPAAFTAIYGLPYTIPSGYYSADKRTIVIPSVPGASLQKYTVNMSTSCGSGEQTVYLQPLDQITGSTAVTINCNQFSVTPNYNIAISAIYLQRQNPDGSDTWGAIDATSAGDYTNTYPFKATLLNNHTANNFTNPAEGNYRVIYQNDFARCLKVLKTFSYSKFRILGVYGSKCSNNTYSVVLQATGGTGNYTYSITQKDGVAYSVNNAANNEFTNLVAGVYNFTASDGCNTLNTLVDITTLSPPKVSSEGFCAGAVGTLSIPAGYGFTYSWYKQSAPSVILSTTNSLSFSSYNSTSDDGTYFVHVKSNTPYSCIDNTFQYVLSSNAPNAGPDVAATVCKSGSGSLNLDKLLDSSVVLAGIWEETTSPASGTLNGNFWNYSALSNGTYTFKYTVKGLCTASDYAIYTVTLTNAATASISYNGSYCSGTATPTQTGLTGGTYSSTTGLSIISATGIINVEASTAGTYTVTYTVTGACSATATATVTITNGPAMPSITTTPATCLAAGAASVTNYIAGTIYTFSPSGPTVGTDGTIANLTATTSYTVTASNGTCTSTASAQFSVDAKLVSPAYPAVSTTSATCSADGTATIANYNSAYTYDFYPVGPTVSAGGLISGLTTSVAAYTVSAFNGTCRSGEVPFSIGPKLPTPAAPTQCGITQPTCTVSTGSVDLCGLPDPWTLVSRDVRGVVIGTYSGTATTGKTTISNLAAGTYKFYVTNSVGCTSTSFATVVINAQPATPAISAITPTCMGGTLNKVTVTAIGTGTLEYSSDGGTSYQSSNEFSSLTNGITYTFTVRDITSQCTVSQPYTPNCTCTTPATPTISGTNASCTAAGTAKISNYNAAYTYTFSPTGPSVGTGGVISSLTTGMNYTVTATSGSCTSAPSERFGVDAQGVTPATPIIATTSATCSADGTATISNYNVDYWYEFIPAGPEVGAGGIITGMTPGTSYTYTVIANINISEFDYCSSDASALFSIGAKLAAPSVPAIGTVTQPSCTVSSGSVALSGLPSTGNWTINITKGTTTGTQTGTGTTATISSLAAGTYTFTVTNANGCTSSATSSVTINAQPSAPSIYAVTGGGHYCAGGTGVLVGLADSDIGTDYQLYFNGTATGTAISGTGSSLDFGVRLIAGTYSVTARTTAGCTATMTGSAEVVIDNCATNLAMTKTVDNATPSVGSDVVFTLTATNKGPIDATDVIVTDVLPLGYTFKTSTLPSVTAAPNLSWNVGNLVNGSNFVVSVTATVNASGNYTNATTVSSTTPDSDLTDNTATSTTTPVPQADLAVSKTVDNATPNVGSNVTFTIVASNNGPSDGTGVKVVDAIPTGYTLVSATPGTGSWTAPNWAIGTLAKGASATLTVVATVNATGNYSNVAVISGLESDPTTTNNTATSTTTPIPVADLAVSKTANLMVPTVGHQVVFTISATNNGPSDGTNVTVSDAIPAGYSLVNALPTFGNWAGNSWNIGTLAAGVTQTLTVTAYVLAAGPYANTVTITGTETDPTTVNNTSTVTPQPVRLADDENHGIVNKDITGNVSTNDKGIPSGSVYSYGSAVAGNPTSNIPVINPDGTYTFNTPQAGIYKFNVQVCVPGGESPCPITLLTITVTDPALINPPVANPDVAETKVNTPVTIPVKGNDLAGNAGGVLGTPTVTVNPLHGTVIVTTDGKIIYTPNTGYTGTDVLTYQVCESPSGLCATTTVEITVLPLNAKNTTLAVDDNYNTPYNTPVSGNVLANDMDAQGDAQAVTAQSGTITGKGSYTLASDGTFTFTPVDGFIGSVDIPYSVTDNNVNPATSSATIHVTVLPPVVKLADDENNGIVNKDITGNVSTNDQVPAGTTYGTPTAVAGNPSGSMPTINSDGTYTFVTPVKGVYQFSVPVCILGEPVCRTTTLTITVTDPALINPPVANPDRAETKVNTPVAIPVKGNDVAGNAGGVLGNPTVTVNPLHGTVIVTTDGKFIYTPNAGYTGTDVLTYQVCETPSGLCATTTVNITVLPTNAVNSTLAVDDNYNTPYNTPVSGNVKTNDMDPQGDTQSVTAQSGTISGKGSYTLASDGTFTFIPVTGFVGSVSIPYSVTDNNVNPATSSATIHVTVLPPVVKLADDENHGIVNSAITGNISTNDTAPAGTTYGSPTAIAGNPSGSMPTVNSDGTYTFVTPVKGVYQFSVPVCILGEPVCRTTTLTITVTDPALINPPVANPDLAETKVNTPVTIPVKGNDLAGNAGGVLGNPTVTVNPLHGTVIVTTDGKFIYTPNTGYTGTDVLTYQVCEAPSGLCATTTVNITVLPTNAVNSTLAVDDNYNTPYNTPISGNVKTNDMDPEGDTQSVTAQSGTISGKGSYTLASDGTFTFIPVTGFVGSVSIPYSVTDSNVNPATASATIHVTVLPGADVVIVKTASDLRPDVGSVIIFTLTAHNNGASIAKSASVTEKIPNGFTLVPPVGVTAGNYDLVNGLWTIGDMNVGSTQTLTVIVRVNPTGTYVNTGTISSTTPDPNTGNNSSTVTVSPVPVSDVYVIKSTPSTSVVAGDVVTFTVTVGNNGPSTASGVHVTDILPGGYTMISETHQVGNWIAPEWGIGSLSKDATVSMQVVARVNPTGVYANTATVTANEKDPDLSNNVSTSRPGFNPLSDVKMVKIVSNASPKVGDQVIFTLVATNNGPNEASGVVISDKLSSGYSFVSTSVSPTTTAPDLSWNIGSLASGSSYSVTVTAKVNASGLYSNTGVVSSTTNDPNTGNNSSTVTVTPVALADLSMSKTVNTTSPKVGDLVTFTLVATNNGPSQAEGVVISDKLSTGYSYISSSAAPTTTAPDLSWNIGSLASGSSYSVTVTAKVNATGLYSNTGVVSSTTNDPNTGNNSSTVTVSPGSIADLTIVKTASSQNPKVGDIVSFTLTALNNGPSQAEGVVVSDKLSTGYIYISSSATPTTTAPDLSWNVGTLASGSSYSVTVTAKVNATGLYSNTGVVSSTTNDPNTGNNSSTVTVTVTPLPSVTLSDLLITKTVSNRTPQVGDQVDFIVTVRNQGPSQATGVTVSDQLPTGYTYISWLADKGNYDNATGKWVIGTLDNGSSAALTVRVKVNTRGNYLNSATVTGTVSDPDTGNNHAEATIEEVCPLLVPEIFTPNGDGVQDYFKIRCIDRYPEATFEVYNRWGNLVYRQEHYGNSDLLDGLAWWDGSCNQKGMIGKFGGEKLPSGTYFYILNLHDGTKGKAGSIFLKR